MSEVVIDLRYIAESQPSLCIPRVFNNIEESRIRLVFDQLGLGKIHHIDIVARQNERGEPFKRVYIHFEKWFWNDTAKAARTKLISGKEIKVVYDNPWFWKVSANKWTPSSREQEHRKEVHPHIEFDHHNADPLPIAAPLLQAHLAPALPQVDEFGRSTAIKKQYEQRTDNRRPRDQRPRDQRPRNDRTSQKPTEKPSEKPVEQVLQPQTPSCSPPRRREPRDEDGIPDIDYGVHHLPPKRLIKLQKKEAAAKVENKPELCEVKESVEQPVDPLYVDL